MKWNEARRRCAIFWECYLFCLPRNLENDKKNMRQKNK